MQKELFDATTHAEYQQRLINTTLLWQQEISDWEATNLKNGYYIGQDLTAYNPSFRPGRYIPITERYSHMLAHQSAEQIAKQFTK